MNLHVNQLFQMYKTTRNILTYAKILLSYYWFRYIYNFLDILHAKCSHINLKICSSSWYLKTHNTKTSQKQTDMYLYTHAHGYGYATSFGESTPLKYGIKIVVVMPSVEL